MKCIYTRFKIKRKQRIDVHMKMIDTILILEQNISDYNVHEIVKINVMFADNRSCKYVQLTTI